MKNFDLVWQIEQVQSSEYAQKTENIVYMSVYGCSLQHQDVVRQLIMENVPSECI